MAVPALRTEKLDLPVSSSAKRRLEAAVAVSHRSVARLFLKSSPCSRAGEEGLGKHSIPIMLLARLAVDLRWQTQGVDAALLKDATLRTLQAAEIAGIRALVVHAKDERARE